MAIIAANADGVIPTGYGPKTPLGAADGQSRPVVAVWLLTISNIDLVIVLQYVDKWEADFCQKWICEEDGSPKDQGSKDKKETTGLTTLTEIALDPERLSKYKAIVIARALT